MNKSIFCVSPTLLELAEAQGVLPLDELESLMGIWPGGRDDEFEVEIDRLRKLSVGRRDPFANS